METPATIMKTWMQRVWNEGDVDAIYEMMADDARTHGLGEEPLIGADGFKLFHAAFSAAFDDIQIEVERQVVDGDRVAIHWSGTMRHGSSGTTVPVTGMVVATVRDGKIREGWNVTDFLPMLITLGIVPGDAVHQALDAG